MYKIQTFNQISDKGLSRFPRQEYQVAPDLKDADAPEGRPSPRGCSPHIMVIGLTTE